jgi:ribonuclease BN (tRNA processing enzyme)
LQNFCNAKLISSHNFYLEGSVNYFCNGVGRSRREDQWDVFTCRPLVPNTSLSVLYWGFHLLVDAGNGVEESIKREAAPSKHLPDAILITHARRHHINDLPRLIGENSKVFCTREYSQQFA